MSLPTGTQALTICSSLPTGVLANGMWAQPLLFLGFFQSLISWTMTGNFWVLL